MSLRSKRIKFIFGLVFVVLILQFINFNYQDIVVLLLLSTILFLLVVDLLDTTQKRHDVRAQATLIDGLLGKQKELLESIPISLLVVDRFLNPIIENNIYTQTISHIEEPLLSFLKRAIIETGSIRQQLIIKNREYLVISNHINFEQQKVTMVLFNDVTSFVDLQSAQKRFIMDASHELKTPITSIKGLSEIMMTRDLNPSDQSEFILQIYEESNRLQKIVSDLIKLSRLNTKQINLNVSAFNFSDCVKDVYQEIRPLLLQKKLNFVYDFKTHNVVLDYDRLRTVLSNLLLNAIQYSTQGTIELKILQIAPHLIFQIKDEGIGIEESHLTHLFDRFYQVDEARSVSATGSGLGLSIVKEIIEAMHGQIEIKSKVGQGTTVIVDIPL